MIEPGTRRSFLVGLIAAPAIVAAGSLMKIRGASLYDVMTLDQYADRVLGNNLLTIQQITRDAVMLFKNSNAFIKSLGEQYDEAFAQTGYKVGDTLRIRLPNDYIVRKFSADEVPDVLQLAAPLPVVAAAGVAAVMTKNPVVSRRFWAR